MILLSVHWKKECRACWWKRRVKLTQESSPTDPGTHNSSFHNDYPIVQAASERAHCQVVATNGRLSHQGAHRPMIFAWGANGHLLFQPAFLILWRRLKADNEEGFIFVIEEEILGRESDYLIKKCNIPNQWTGRTLSMLEECF